MNSLLIRQPRWYLAIALVAVVGSAWVHWTRIPTEADVVDTTAAHTGFQAPDFELASLDGKNISLASLRGHIVLVNFWATWCLPCRKEMPEIETAYRAHPGTFIVLAINNREDASLVQRYISELNLDFPILLDPDGAAASAYNVMGLPTSFIIDRAGIIRAANIGGMNRAYIEAQLKDLEVR
jgi:cytochrome c biogenesis protein CcmG, thiol:disulfide interchange protein DsbE